MSKDLELEKRLWLVAENEAARRSFEITSSANAFLKSLIHKGVARLISDGYENDEIHIKMAEDNLVKVIDRTAIEDRKMGFKYFREPTFNGVLKFLCPLWPFC